MNNLEGTRAMSGGWNDDDDDGDRRSGSGSNSTTSLQAIINQILGSTGGTAGSLPSRTSGSDFISWLSKLFGTSATPAPTPPPIPGQPSSTSSILAQLMANAGKGAAPNSPLGAVVQNPLPGGGFDPFKYGQTGGEATFYHTTPDAKFAPIAAMPGLGAPAPNLNISDKKKKGDDDDDD